MSGTKALLDTHGVFWVTNTSFGIFFFFSPHAVGSGGDDIALQASCPGR